MTTFEEQHRNFYTSVIKSNGNDPNNNLIEKVESFSSSGFLGGPKVRGAAKLLCWKKGLSLLSLLVTRSSHGRCWRARGSFEGQVPRELTTYMAAAAFNSIVPGFRMAQPNCHVIKSWPWRTIITTSYIHAPWRVGFHNFSVELGVKRVSLSNRSKRILCNYDVLFTYIKNLMLPIKS